jgi:hypothetical protein
MNAIEFVKMSLEMSNGWIMGLVEDIKDAPLTKPTPHGGNHPLWCVGHLAFSEGNLVQVFIKGEANPLAEWANLFDQGTTALDDASQYPPIDEVIGKLQGLRAGTMALLNELTDEDLNKPSHAPDEMKEWFGTVGQCLAAIPIHFAFHGGQIADARRAAGRAPMMG